MRYGATEGCVSISSYPERGPRVFGDDAFPRKLGYCHEKPPALLERGEGGLAPKSDPGDGERDREIEMKRTRIGRFRMFVCLSAARAWLRV